MAWEDEPTGPVRPSMAACSPCRAPLLGVYFFFLLVSLSAFTVPQVMPAGILKYLRDLTCGCQLAATALLATWVPTDVMAIMSWKGVNELSGMPYQYLIVTIRTDGRCAALHCFKSCMSHVSHEMHLG